MHTPSPTDESESAEPTSRIRQFRLLDLFLATAIFAGLSGLLRLLGVPPWGWLLIGALLIVCLLGGAALLYSITRMLNDEDHG